MSGSSPDPVTQTKVGDILQDKALNVSYQILDTLGYGTYGSIYLAKVILPPSSLSSSPSLSRTTSSSSISSVSSSSLATSEFRAIKCLSKRGLTPNQLQLQRQEIDIHMSLSSARQGRHHHENIVDMSSVIETRDFLFLVMEYCSGGDLYDAITSQHSAARDSGVGFDSFHTTASAGGFGIPQALNVHSDQSVLNAMHQIVSALGHAHENKVFHRDIKPENILLSESGTLKLADFGLATKERVSSDFGCGSSFYMAPEQQPISIGVNSRASNAGRRPYLPEKSDIWSLGVIFLNLRFGRNPWKLSRADADPTFAAYQQNPKVLHDMFPDLTPVALQFLHRVLCVDPKKRANCTEALELLEQIDTIVVSSSQQQLLSSMEDCESEIDDKGRGSSSASSSSSLSMVSLSESLATANTVIASLAATSTAVETMTPSHSNIEGMFHMEDDYGASPRPVHLSQQQQMVSPVFVGAKSFAWSSSSSSSASSTSFSSSSSSEKSWSEMADEDEMDFSIPVEFDEQQQQQQAAAAASASAVASMETDSSSSCVTVASNAVVSAIASVSFVSALGTVIASSSPLLPAVTLEEQASSKQPQKQQKQTNYENQKPSNDFFNDLYNNKNHTKNNTHNHHKNQKNEKTSSNKFRSTSKTRAEYPHVSSSPNSAARVDDDHESEDGIEVRGTRGAHYHHHHYNLRTSKKVRHHHPYVATTATTIDGVTGSSTPAIPTTTAPPPISVPVLPVLRMLNNRHDPSLESSRTLLCSSTWSQGSSTSTLNSPCSPAEGDSTLGSTSFAFFASPGYPKLSELVFNRIASPLSSPVHPQQMETLPPAILQ